MYGVVFLCLQISKLVMILKFSPLRFRETSSLFSSELKHYSCIYSYETRVVFIHQVVSSLTILKINITQSHSGSSLMDGALRPGRKPRQTRELSELLSQAFQPQRLHSGPLLIYVPSYYGKNLVGFVKMKLSVSPLNVFSSCSEIRGKYMNETRLYLK